MVSTIPAGVKSRSKSPRNREPMISAPKKPDGPAATVEARSVRLLAKADDPASLAPVIERRTLSRAANEVLIEVKAGAVNSSHLKDAICLMPYAVCPLTRSRHYAGVVVASPAASLRRGGLRSSCEL